MKPCKQNLNFGACLFGRVLPLYCLFGNVSGITYYSDSRGLHVYNTRRQAWQKARMDNPRYNRIFGYMEAFCETPGYIDKPTIECIRYNRDMTAVVPREKKHPEPMYGKTSGCYSQARVDGRGYNNDWEEKNIPNRGNGLPVEYNQNKPVATFKSFEGYTDTPEAKRRDGLKVDQTKIRPEKRLKSLKVIVRSCTESGIPYPTRTFTCG